MCEISDGLLNKFNDIWQAAKLNSPLNHKSAVCISTVDEDGFPQSRFVDLKAVDTSGFTFCSAYHSDKSRQLSANSKVSLVAWWDHTGHQVRVAGHAKQISNEQADTYWSTRSHEAKVATLAFKQSQPWREECSLTSHYNATISSTMPPVKRPDSWGGYTIVPVSIEFLTFQNNRVHHREKYTQHDGKWLKAILQP